jgi:serine/threonine protein kinase
LWAGVFWVFVNFLFSTGLVFYVSVIDFFFLSRSVIILCYSGKDVPSSKEEIEKFMFQILQGLVYMRNNDIFHGDLKPGNLVMSSV